MQRQARVDGSLSRQQLPQVLAFDIFLRDEVHTLDAVDIEDLHDVGVRDIRGGGRPASM